jgi:hypothetical protein
MGMGMSINMSGLGMGYDGGMSGPPYDGVDMGMGVYAPDSTVPFDLGMNAMGGGMGQYHQQQLDMFDSNGNMTAGHDPATMAYTGFEFNDIHE